MKLAEEWTDIREEETGSMGPQMELPEILEDVKGFLSRYILFSKEAQALVVTLWVAHTLVIEAFDYTPYLQISSPVKRCGKSRVFDCLKLLCAKPWVVVSITEAVMFRKIEKDAPTLLLDEIDAVFTAKKGDDGKEAIRALLNAGFERRAIVPRCVGPNHALKEFRVFCPKALAGIGKLPDTIADRSIPIIMARRKRGQNVEKFRARDAEVIAKPVAVALEAWATRPQTLEILRAARPTMPNALGDRATDISEPLLAIADMAGGDWPSKARDALVELCAAGDVAEDCIGIKLLAAIREIFEMGKVDRISTKDLLAALVERDCDEPWADWWEADIAKGNTRGPAAKLARLLKPFGVVAGTIREEHGSTAKGYKLASFEDAFSRYLSPPPPSGSAQKDDTTSQAA
jgi:Protein of unknown function (DUF3631)